MAEERNAGSTPGAGTAIATARVVLNNDPERPVSVSVPRDITTEDALIIAGWLIGMMGALIAGERAKASQEAARAEGLAMSAEEARKRIIIQ